VYVLDALGKEVWCLERFLFRPYDKQAAAFDYLGKGRASLIMQITIEMTFVRVAIPLILCMKLSTTLSATMMLRAHP
jgi:hypothetical protein